MIAADWIVLAVASQRIGEVIYARRNEQRLRAMGAIEVGGGHYPLFVLLHTVWLAAVLMGAHETEGALNPGWLAVFLLAQVGRGWVLWALGRFWTTRILTLPETPLVQRGPYRWMRHPNYVIVTVEIAALPLCFGLWTVAATFSVLNAALLFHRVRVEDHALSARRALTGERRLGT